MFRSTFMVFQRELRPASVRTQSSASVSRGTYMHPCWCGQWEFREGDVHVSLSARLYAAYRAPMSISA